MFRACRTGCAPWACRYVWRIRTQALARADYTARTYRIADPNGLTLENLAAYVDEVAQRYKRRAVIHTAHNWRNIGRVYFLLEDMPKQPPRLNEKKTPKNLRG